MYGNTQIGVLLLITHILACISVGFIFSFWKKNSNSIFFHNVKKSGLNAQISFSDLGEIFSKSILSSIKTILMIGGFVVLFSVILSILKESKILYVISNSIYPLLKFLGINNNNFSLGLVSGLLEVTNGLNIIANIPFKKISLNIILSAFLLGFGGISVLLQVYSIISKSNISIKPYLIGKLLHGILASFYTYLAIYTLPFFNLDL